MIRGFTLYDYWRDLPLVTFITSELWQAQMWAWEYCHGNYKDRCDLRPITRRGVK